MEIDITYDKKDWDDYMSYVTTEMFDYDQLWKDRLWLYLTSAIVGIGIALLWISGIIEFHWQTALSVAIILCLYATIIIFTGKNPEPHPEGVFCGSHKFSFTTNGIQIQGNGYRSNYSWNVIKQIKDEEEMILIYIDSIQAFIFPKNKLSDHEAFYSFLNNEFKKHT